MLENFKPLSKAAKIIKYHHLPWDGGAGVSYMGEEVLLLSHILHVADRTCAMLSSSGNVLSQVPRIIEEISKKADTSFHPALVDALNQLSQKEYIWLDLSSASPIDKISDTGMFSILILDVDDIIDLAYIFSQIIDFRSSFTAQHSAGVAKTAEKLAQLIGFSPYDCQMMLIAGYLHDLGKLAIDNSLLEKPGKLDKDEYNQIRSHTYHTYHLLSSIKQFETINKWASYHHEKLNGNGYPFHINGNFLSLGSRIMAVADVFTAITENRPYRMGMDYERTTKVLYNMVESDSIDGNIVKILMQNFDEINELRLKAQNEAAERYTNFLLAE